MKKSEDMKERIIRAATELIEEGSGKAEKITTRMIADKAGIGVGLIHYHFQTKERLVELCVQRIIGQVIARFKPSGAEALKGSEALKSVAREVADFLAENPSISRISILGDCAAPTLQDNTARTMQGFAKTFGGPRGMDSGGGTEAGGDADAMLRARLFTLTSTLQAAFLRKDISRELFGYDINDKRERDQFVGWLTDQLFESLNA